MVLQNVKLGFGFYFLFFSSQFIVGVQEFFFFWFRSQLLKRFILNAWIYVMGYVVWMVRRTEKLPTWRENDAETKSKEFPYCVVIRLRWKGPFLQYAPPLINLILGFNTMHENRFIVQLVPIRVFFSPQWGLGDDWLAGWLAGRLLSLAITMSLSLKLSHTF